MLWLFSRAVNQTKTYVAAVDLARNLGFFLLSRPT